MCSANRAQQAYYLENNTFAQAGQFTQLGLGVQTTTTNYEYTIVSSGAGVTPAFTRIFGSVAPLSTAPLKAYLGGVTVGTVGTAANQDATTLAALCESIDPNTINGQGRKLADTDLTLTTTAATCTAKAKAIK